MKVLTNAYIKKNFSKIFEMVKNGEEIIVSESKNKEKFAIIQPYTKYKLSNERPLGILKGVASFKIKSDFKITEQEFLGS